VSLAAALIVFIVIDLSPLTYGGSGGVCWCGLVAAVVVVSTATTARVGVGRVKRERVTAR